VLHRVFVDRRPITFVGPAGIAAYLERLWEVSWGPDWKRVMRPQFNVKYVTAKASGTVAGVKYETVKLDHGTMGSNGYRIHVKGKVIAYSGDTEPTAPLDRLVDGADVAIVEATGPGDVFSHMSWDAAAKLKKRHPNTRFFFNHVYSGQIAGAVKDLQVTEV
jgi:ribonuclease BN (tRNA processing enzyme)